MAKATAEKVAQHEAETAEWEQLTEKLKEEEGRTEADFVDYMADDLRHYIGQQKKRIAQLDQMQQGRINLAMFKGLGGMIEVHQDNIAAAERARETVRR